MMLQPLPVEEAVIARLLADPKLDPPRRDADANEMMLERRDYSAVGFLTHISPTPAAKLFTDDVSLRWSRVMGRLNDALDVIFVAYVDNGFLTCLECATFGGDLLPESIDSFTLTDLPDK